jgi:membrane protein required for colicin V production
VLTGIAPLDIFFFVIIVAAAVRGVIRGFVTESLAMAALILGVAMAVVFARPVAEQLAGLWGESMWNYVAGFALVFLAVYLVVKLLEGLLQRLLETLSLRPVDRLLGLVLGAGEGLLLVAIVLFLLNWQPFFNAQVLLDESLFAALLLPLLPPPSNLSVPQTGGADV